MRRFLPLLLGVIVTPLSAAARHETMLAHVVDEGDTNLPVSRGRVDTGSTEQICLILKEGCAFTAAIALTNRFTYELKDKDVSLDADQRHRWRLKGAQANYLNEATTRRCRHKPQKLFDHQSTGRQYANI